MIYKLFIGTPGKVRCPPIGGSGPDRRQNGGETKCERKVPELEKADFSLIYRHVCGRRWRRGRRESYKLWDVFPKPRLYSHDIAIDVGISILLTFPPTQAA
ncbi:hypothetical protein GWI33_010369 [Rhynchophorus ferrugineus]|uniref:Uncharacterized protein n=1 Tax=Rhynchophorus ferrugineus TaxID=354439 RepID=A0A834I8D0_RHYFE|nr:hypothetical protein GWI33_010369 [Rhynchophorus ferrugineus]